MFGAGGVLAARACTVNARCESARRSTGIMTRISLLSIHSGPRAYHGRRVAAPTSLKSERIFSDRKMTLYIILEHPTATGPTTVHAMHISDTIQLHSPSPWARERREHRPPPAYTSIASSIEELQRPSVASYWKRLQCCHASMPVSSWRRCYWCH